MASKLSAGLLWRISRFSLLFLQRIDQPWDSCASFIFVFVDLYFHSLVNDFRHDLPEQLSRVGFAKFFVRFFCSLFIHLCLLLFNVETGEEG